MRLIKKGREREREREREENEFFLVFQFGSSVPHGNSLDPHIYTYLNYCFS